MHASAQALATAADGGRPPPRRRAAAQSPFARSPRTHFARFVIIDDVVYNGRIRANTLIDGGRRDDDPAGRPAAVDRLPLPFLLFVGDFDAPSGDRRERDAYLAELWSDDGAAICAHLRLSATASTAVDRTRVFADYIARMPGRDDDAVQRLLDRWPPRCRPAPVRPF